MSIENPYKDLRKDNYFPIQNLENIDPSIS